MSLETNCFVVFVKHVCITRHYQTYDTIKQPSIELYTIKTHVNPCIFLYLSFCFVNLIFFFNFQGTMQQYIRTILQLYF